MVSWEVSCGEMMKICLSSSSNIIGWGSLRMIYHAWIIPGIHPSIQSNMLMRKAQEQQPLLMHTGRGGKITAINTSSQSQHIISQQHIVSRVII